MKHRIKRADAKRLTRQFREQRDQVVIPELRRKNTIPNSETFDREIIDAILSQPDCTGLRIYFGLNDQRQVRAVLVGVNQKNEDILSSTNNLETDSSLIAEDGNVCPPICPPKSDLNSND